MRTLYFDCFAGVSGNMVLGGLVAPGADRDELVRRLESLAPTGFKIEFETVDRSGISAIHANVVVPDESKHRHLSHVEKIIDSSSVSDSVKSRSKAIFRRLAEAEAKVHGTSIEKVHFHEVGAMDAIIDIVGSCIGFEMLGIERFACSKIHVGSGFVDMAHGKYPVPPPAVAELLMGVPYYSTEVVGELATPTGVAIVATLSDNFGESVEFTPDAVGYGAGSRAYDNFPNALRMMIGESVKVTTGGRRDRLTLLETNIDDLSPQVLAFVMEQAFEAGALDCWFTPIQMRKNRPAVMLSIPCETGIQQTLSEMIYRETTTLGIRIRSVDRECLEREVVSVETQYGAVDVKVGTLNGNVVNVMPEYDQVRRIARDADVAFRDVRDAALSAYKSGKSRSAAS